MINFCKCNANWRIEYVERNAHPLECLKFKAPFNWEEHLSLLDCLQAWVYQHKFGKRKFYFLSNLRLKLSKMDRGIRLDFFVEQKASYLLFIPSCWHEYFWATIKFFQWCDHSGKSWTWAQTGRAFAVFHRYSWGFQNDLGPNFSRNWRGEKRSYASIVWPYPKYDATNIPSVFEQTLDIRNLNFVAVFSLHFGCFSIT